MALTDVFSKAKEVRDRAMEAAESGLDKTKGMTELGLDKTKELTELGLDRTKELTEQARDASQRLTDAGREKMQETISGTLSEMQSLRDILARSGFSTEDIALTMGIPPGLTIEVHRIGKGTESLEELAQTEGLSALQSAVIRALKNAYAMDGMIHRFGYEIGMIEVELGLSPAVKVHLARTSADD